VLVFALAAGGMVLTSVLLWRLPLQDWFQFRVMDASTARWALWLLAAEVFARLPNGVTHAGFRASGEYALHIGLDNTTRLLQFAGVWGTALVGGGPIAAAAVYFGIRALVTPVLAVALVRRHPWLRFGLARARIGELRRLFRPALASMAIPVAQALNIQGMVLVIGAVLSPLAVVVFSTLRTLTRLALQMVLVVSHAAEPELAAVYGAGKQALAQALFIHALRASLWLAVTAATCLALFGGIIVNVWTHGKVAMDPALFAWLLGSAVATALWYSGLIVLKAANRHLRAAALLVLSSSGVVGVAAVLLSWTGDLATAGLALLLMDVVMASFTLQAAARLLGVAAFVSLVQAANPYPLVRFALAKVHSR
jgi:O-antigen/teichoic acid export membrane protein